MSPRLDELLHRRLDGRELVRVRDRRLRRRERDANEREEQEERTHGKPSELTDQSAFAISRRIDASSLIDPEFLSWSTMRDRGQPVAADLTYSRPSRSGKSASTSSHLPLDQHRCRPCRFGSLVMSDVRWIEYPNSVAFTVRSTRRGAKAVAPSRDVLAWAQRLKRAAGAHQNAEKDAIPERTRLCMRSGGAAWGSKMQNSRQTLGSMWSNPVCSKHLLSLSCEFGEFEFIPIESGAIAVQNDHIEPTRNGSVVKGSARKPCKYTSSPDRSL